MRAPAGIVAYDPGDLTVPWPRVRPSASSRRFLADHGQECVLDRAFVRGDLGGVLATGLSGHRRLRYGPVRDRVLEVRFVTADGRVVKGGGPTVKNVSGFDLPRLLVGSFGTIGVLVQVILRCQPLPAASQWIVTDARTDRGASLRVPPVVHRLGRDDHPGAARRRASPTSRRNATLLHGGPRSPTHPRGPPARTGAACRCVRRHSARVGAALDLVGVRWLAEVGVGTVHVAADTEASDRAARGVRQKPPAAGCSVRRVHRASTPSAPSAPNHLLMERVRAAFDPGGKLGRGRLRGALPPVDAGVEGVRA